MSLYPVVLTYASDSPPVPSVVSVDKKLLVRVPVKGTLKQSRAVCNMLETPVEAPAQLDMC